MALAPVQNALGASRARRQAHRELLENLTLRDVKARYKQTILGLYWSILSPVATALIFTLVFSIIVRVPTQGVPYPVFVLAGLLPWTFFANSVTSGVSSLVGNSNLLTKVYFPRAILPAAAVLARVVDLLASLVVLAVMMAVYRIPATWGLALLPLVIVVQVLFAMGISFIVSGANLFYRDVGQVLTLVLTLWMFVTPVVYSIDLVPARYLWLYMLNPMAALVASYRQLILYGTVNLEYLGVATGLSVVVFAAGYLLFRRWEPLFAEVV